MTADSKQTLREQIRELRRHLDPVWVQATSARIIERVIGLPEFASARTVGCYLALSHEVQTRALIDTCWNRGKRVCVPTFYSSEDRYGLAWFNPDSGTKRGPMKVPEPKLVHEAPVTAVELMIVPAMAFDRRGHRLGHGGGHYDRMLAAFNRPKVGVAFQFQVLNEVPVEPGDVSVDVVITEGTVYRPGTGGQPI